MNVSQNVTAIFRSPEMAYLANQAVQASELAARQASASLQHDATRRQDQVTASGDVALPEAVDGQPLPPEARPPRRRPRPSPPSTPGSPPPTPAPGHIDLIA